MPDWFLKLKNMKNLIKYFKTGMSLIPVWLIILYLMFIATDIITTYMASPDLKYEFNRIVRYFDLNFTGIIIMSSINAAGVIIYLFTGRGYLENYFEEKYVEGQSLFYRIFHNWRLLLSLILISIFFGHLFSSFYATINNYLGHIYLNKPESILKGIANSYIGFTNPYGALYVRFMQGVNTILGAIFTLYYFRSLESCKRKNSAEYSIAGD
jgi:hypothetical protein